MYALFLNHTSNECPLILITFVPAGIRKAKVGSPVTKHTLLQTCFIPSTALTPKNIWAFHYFPLFGWGTKLSYLANKNNKPHDYGIT